MNGDKINAFVQQGNILLLVEAERTLFVLYLFYSFHTSLNKSTN
jgi:hypothetical protein